MSIGIRALRDSLSSQLQAVRNGQSLTVTDHGHAIARIVPVEGASAFEQLLAEQLLTAPTAPRTPLPRPIAAKGPVSDLVEAQRA
ncbi:type II toxin-antitoxin system Phd/YefM family antitoxin [Rathayibacter soli]|uniref:type II toxin-antitoxin system Phd/YefM family antitoxin n=1 Tax=Rathayibacter soli TaxID=3144168 RepID=UPI0027E3F38C|nr:type II toxin-antitoxin system Phd/YefM family antitoxin [Glaciibacter superstes]